MKLTWKRRHRERDLQREIENHLALEAEERQEGGALPREADHASRRALGNATVIKEEIRDTWSGASLERFYRDVVYSMRLLRKTPAATSILIATLALGLGMNTAVFSVVNAVMLRPLPYADPGRLVSLWEEIVKREPSQIRTSGASLGGNSGPRRTTVSIANLADYQ